MRGNFYLVIMCLLIYSRCKFPVERVYTADLLNMSSHSIGYYFATGGKYGTVYPDSLPKTGTYIMKDIDKVKSPGLESHIDWIQFFDYLPKDTLSVYIFHTDTLTKYPWKYIRKNYKILKRYDLGIEDLKLLNYKIPYPPSEQMKDMKIYAK